MCGRSQEVTKLSFIADVTYLRGTCFVTTPICRSLDAAGGVSHHPSNPLALVPPVDRRSHLESLHCWKTTAPFRCTAHETLLSSRMLTMANQYPLSPLCSSSVCSYCSLVLSLGILWFLVTLPSVGSASLNFALDVVAPVVLFTP